MGKNTREFNTTKVKGRDSKESHFFSLIRLIKTVNRELLSVLESSVAVGECKLE